MNPDKDVAPQDTNKGSCDLEQIEKIEHAKEERQLRHWLIRRGFTLISFVVLLVVISLVYDFIFLSGKTGDTSSAGGFITNVFQVFKVLIEQ